MQIAICDDEKEIREMLAEKLKALYPGADLSLYQSGEEVLAADRQPDLLLLDIQMPEKDGMETARQLRRSNQKTMIIFVTAWEDFVFQAFDVGAFHYLVKPFHDAKLTEVLQNAISQLEERKKQEMALSQKEPPSLMITTAGKHIAIRLEDIVYAEVFNRKVIIHTLDSDIEYYGKNTDIYDVLTLLYYAASIIAVIVAIGLYQSIKAGQEETLQNKLLATQIRDIRQHIEQAEDLYEDIRHIRHDMTNHIMTLERLYAGDKTDEAKDYSTKLKTALAETTLQINSGNPVSDVILQEMQSRAAKKGISFQVDFHFPTGTDINAFDISVILNNALQNALEHTEKDEKAYISIHSYRRNNAYMIEVNNSFTGNLRWDAEHELPVTTKRDTSGDSQIHGYGLTNIRRVAQKYSGDIAVSLKEKEFCLSVMMMTET